MTKVALTVFDVGGTTIRDTADVAAVFASALGKYDIAAAPEQLRAWRGASKREVIRALVMASSREEADVERVYRTFQDLLIDAFATRGVSPIPDIEAAFDRLRAQGIQVVLATGFDARVMGFLIEKLGWQEAVDGLVTSDDVTRGRPAPDLILMAMSRANVGDVGAVVAVGDTVNDLKAAHAASVGASIGVLTGAHERQRLAAAHPTAILDSAADVPAWLADRQWSAP